MVANVPPFEQTPGPASVFPAGSSNRAARLRTLCVVIAALFAHQGGWDEAIFVAVPIAIFAGLLLVANKRASRIEDERNRGAGPRRDGGDADRRKPRSGR